jgi:hypothetical protein
LKGASRRRAFFKGHLVLLKDCKRSGEAGSPKFRFIKTLCICQLVPEDVPSRFLEVSDSLSNKSEFVVLKKQICGKRFADCPVQFPGVPTAGDSEVGFGIGQNEIEKPWLWDTEDIKRFGDGVSILENGCWLLRVPSFPPEQSVEDIRKAAEERRQRELAEAARIRAEAEAARAAERRAREEAAAAERRKIEQLREAERVRLQQVRARGVVIVGSHVSGLQGWYK